MMMMKKKKKKKKKRKKMMIMMKKDLRRRRWRRWRRWRWTLITDYWVMGFSWFTLLVSWSIRRNFMMREGFFFVLVLGGFFWFWICFWVVVVRSVIIEATISERMQQFGK
jgi:hypothetical protein